MDAKRALLDEGAREVKKTEERVDVRRRRRMLLRGVFLSSKFVTVKPKIGIVE